MPQTLLLKSLVPLTSIHSAIEVDQTIATNIMIFMIRCRRQLMLLIRIRKAWPSTLCRHAQAKTADPRSGLRAGAVRIDAGAALRGARVLRRRCAALRSRTVAGHAGRFLHRPLRAARKQGHAQQVRRTAQRTPRERIIVEDDASSSRTERGQATFQQPARADSTVGSFFTCWTFPRLLPLAPDLLLPPPSSHSPDEVVLWFSDFYL